MQVLYKIFLWITFIYFYLLLFLSLLCYISIMKIHRFYIKDFSYSENIEIKDKEIIHQTNNVLKLRSDENISIFNGLENIDYIYKIKDINKKHLSLIFLESTEPDFTINKKSFEINVFISIIKSDFDKVVRELVEIGVDSISPIVSEKTERKEINHERFHKIITEATEQSGRTFLPKLNEVTKLKDLLERPDFILEKNIQDDGGLSSHTINICYHTQVSQTKQSDGEIKSGETNNVVKKIDNLNIFIGPEGGWSSGEIETFEKLGFEIKKLNTFILKTSTAGVLCTYDTIKSFT